MVDAHEQRLTVHILEHFPAHEPRESDPHYHLFNEVKRRMKAMGLWKCVVCGSIEDVELHHSEVEFAYANGISVEKVNELLGLHLTEDDFVVWIESPANLEPLCRAHHRGLYAVHSLPEPVWNAVRLWKDGMEPPAEVDR